MRLLLDTHTLLWFLLDDPRLAGIAREAIADGGNSVEVSPAPYWEIAFKFSRAARALWAPDAHDEM